MTRQHHNHLRFNVTDLTFCINWDSMRDRLSGIQVRETDDTVSILFGKLRKREGGVILNRMDHRRRIVPADRNRLVIIVGVVAAGIGGNQFNRLSQVGALIGKIQADTGDQRVQGGNLRRPGR